MYEKKKVQAAIIRAEAKAEQYETRAEKAEAALAAAPSPRNYCRIEMAKQFQEQRDEARARAEKMEAELAALQRSNEKRGVEVSSELEALESRAEAAEKRAVALEGYARHLNSCRKTGQPEWTTYNCTCGLSALLVVPS